MYRYVANYGPHLYNEEKKITIRWGVTTPTKVVWAVL